MGVGSSCGGRWIRGAAGQTVAPFLNCCPQVSDIKGRIESSQGPEFSAASMKVIYNGKVGRGLHGGWGCRALWFSNTLLERHSPSGAPPWQVLADEATVQESGLAEKGFCVVMMVKVRLCGGEGRRCRGQER